ncbi:MAG: hypothetical protein HY897_08315 [Deltaproteobacteria bacterium]|nr:hypothetical protein [Deltaproteobacteria bacterium]
MRPARLLFVVFSVYVLWRGSLLLFAFAGTNLGYAPFFAPKSGAERPSGYFVEAWCQWDCAWYDRIIDHGYTAASYGRHDQREAAFFPLYPALSRGLGEIIGSRRAAGLIVSHTGAILGLFFTLLLGLLFFDEEKAKRALVLLLVFPGSVFLSAFYSEGLFLCGAAGSFFWFFKRRWLLCGLFGALAVLSRSAGILLFPVFAAALAYDIARRRDRFDWAMLWLLLIPAALGAYMAALHAAVGDPFAFVAAQRGWGRTFTFPLATIAREIGGIDPGFPKGARNVHRIADTAAAVSFLGISAAMALRRYHPALWLFVAGGVLMPLSTGQANSMVRFVAVLFPAFYFLADISEDRRTERALVYGFSFFLAVYTLMFLNGRWAG